MLRPNEFDPLAYIENAFLDKTNQEVLPNSGELSVAIPSISDYLTTKDQTNGQTAKESVSSTATVDRPVAEPAEKLVEALIDQPAVRISHDLFSTNGHPLVIEEISDGGNSPR